MLKKTNGPTLVDVAREAGVSLKTASRALNKDPGIAPATAKKVRTVMSRLGYRPNEVARGLKGMRNVGGERVGNAGPPSGRRPYHRPCRWTDQHGRLIHLCQYSRCLV